MFATILSSCVILNGVQTDKYGQTALRLAQWMDTHLHLGFEHFYVASARISTV